MDIPLEPKLTCKLQMCWHFQQTDLIHLKCKIWANTFLDQHRTKYIYIFHRNSWKIFQSTLWKCMSVDIDSELLTLINLLKIIKLFNGNRFDECIHGSRNRGKARQTLKKEGYCIYSGHISKLFNVNSANPLFHHLLYGLTLMSDLW